MDFREIAEMQDVMNHISRNSNLSRLEYLVSVYSDDKKRSVTKQPEQKLRFGNLKGKSLNNLVVIDVYRDQVYLYHNAEGSLHHTAEFGRYKEIRLETKILMAFDRWSSYYHK